MARSPAARAGLHAGRGSGSIYWHFFALPCVYNGAKLRQIYRNGFGSFRGPVHGHTSNVQLSLLTDTASAIRARTRAQVSGILRSKVGASLAFQEPFQPGVGRFMVCSLALVLALGRGRRARRVSVKDRRRMDAVGVARVGVVSVGRGRSRCPQGASRAGGGWRVFMPARGLVHGCCSFR